MRKCIRAVCEGNTEKLGTISDNDFDSFIAKNSKNRVMLGELKQGEIYTLAVLILDDEWLDHVEVYSNIIFFGKSMDRYTFEFSGRNKKLTLDSENVYAYQGKVRF